MALSCSSFGLVIQFPEHLQIYSTSNHNALANSCTRLLTTSSLALTCSCHYRLVTALQPTNSTATHCHALSTGCCVTMVPCLMMSPHILCHNLATALSQLSHHSMDTWICAMKVQLSNTTNLSDIHSDFAAMLDTLSRNWEVHIIEQTL